MRIVIVEDEIKIREGMGKMIKSQTGHQIVGEAADGKEGLEMILRLHPDLVITDIRMPCMNGLEMLKELSVKKAKVHAVILSGYSEFEYAQKAIRYGVDDYLLKPISIDDVREMLEKVEKSIQNEKEWIYGQQENRIRDVLFGNVEESEQSIEEMCTSCGFEPDMQYELMAGYIGSTQSSYKELVEKVISGLKKLYYDFEIYLLYQRDQQTFFCLTAGRELKGKEKEKYDHDLYIQLIKSCEESGEHPVWCKADCTVWNLQETRKKLQENLEYGLVMKPGRWITEEGIQVYEAERFEYPLDIGNNLKNAVCQGGNEQIAEVGEAFTEYMRMHQYMPSDMRYGFMKSYYLISDILKDIDSALQEHLENSGILGRMENALTFEELHGAWIDVIKTITGERVKREEISNYIIQKAIQYIREHYQEGITQEEVSRKLEITPEYLSTLFSREMGINFSLFLKRFRMSHAKRLLKGTDKRIYEIARMVGYSDVKYFARVFKEEQGVTPGEYRRMD